MSGPLRVYTKAAEDGSQRRYIAATASSSIKDLHGDEFTDECVRKMAVSAKQKGMTIFLNHSYKVPEDVFGSTTDATSVIRSEGADMFTDMDIEVMLNESNDRAVQAFESLDAGVKLGVSIGCLVKEWHPRDPKDTWGFDGMVIEDVELLEASVVGIPANPRSWVSSAVYALKQAIKEEQDEDGTSSTLALLVSSADDKLDGGPLTDDESEGDPETPDADDVTKSANAEENPPQTETTETEPTTEPPSDGAPVEEKDAPVPTVTASDEDAAAPGGDAVEKSLTVLVNSYKQHISTLEAQLSLVTKERDEAQEGLQVATAIIEKIASLPLGRKASFHAGVSEFRTRLAGVYGDDFLKLLERTPEQ